MCAASKHSDPAFYLSSPLVCLAVSLHLSSVLSPRKLCSEDLSTSFRLNTKLSLGCQLLQSATNSAQPVEILLFPTILLLTTADPETLCLNLSSPATLSVTFCYLNPINIVYTIPSVIRANSTLMSVDIRLCLNCLRYPSRFMSVSRTQLSRVHTGDSIQNLQRS